MSLFDLRFRKSGQSRWEGMQPPGFSLRAIRADYKWHKALYRSNRLPLKTRFVFHLLRILQLLAYSRGWKKGTRQ